MRVASVLSSLLVFAWLALDVALAAHLLRSPPIWPQPLAPCSLGLAFGQTALACAWFVWSRRNLTIRLVAGAVALFLCSVLASASTDGGAHANVWLTFFVVYAGLLSAALAAFRWSRVHVVSPDVGVATSGGCRLVTQGDRDSLPMAAGTSLGTSQRPPPTWKKSPDSFLTPASSRGLRAWQFSLGALFSCMTTVAVPLGLAHWVELPSKSLCSVLAFGLSLTVASLIPLGISCRCRSPLRAALVLAVFCPGLAMLFPLTAIPPRDYLALALMASVQGGSIAGSVAVLRIAGYRLAISERA